MIRYIAILFLITGVASAQVVDIPDPNLRAVIEFYLGKAEGDTITVADMETLTNFATLKAGISDLSGLEHATNLRTLELYSDPISDISALAGLTNLTYLVLGGNSISDISAVASLTNLIALNLVENNISDISALAGLTNLTHLDLCCNFISGISAVAGLTNLIDLRLSENNISDISPLAGLTNLTYLVLDGNSISDISYLVANTGLGAGDWVNVKGNPLNTASINSHIPALQRRGADVDFDAVTTPAGINIPDPNLRAAIEHQLGKGAGDTISIDDMETMSELEAIFATISDLTGLEHAINLTSLDLSSNSISDISPLAGLTNLTVLWLEDNWVDLSGLSGLTNLTLLDLSLNAISDISPLSGLTKLEWLRLGDNPIEDTTVLCPLLEQNPNLNLDIETDCDWEIVPPQFRFEVVPKYPEAARRENKEGQVILEATIDENGIPQDIKVLTNLGFGLEEAAVEALKKTTFHPATRGGNPISQRIRIPYTFTLTDEPALSADVNGDGVVNILDLVLVAQNLEQMGANGADVNGDGVVNILDLVAVAGAIGGGGAAPSAHPRAVAMFHAADIQAWLAEARQLGLTDASSRRGILFLEHLMTVFTPTATVLLPNYPNPFNPETWIPYQLTHDAHVKLTIYDANGALVRLLDVGHQPAGFYTDRGRAAYWDGRNESGEAVASGVYFYTLSAGEFTATRKMLIRK